MLDRVIDAALIIMAGLALGEILSVVLRRYSRRLSIGTLYLYWMDGK